MIYVKVTNAIYVIINVELLFYKKFVVYPNTIGFRLNPYEKFVTNKLVMVKQLSMVWNVNDLNVIHERNKIVSMMSKWLKKTYGITFEDGSGNVNISIDNIHEYLGTTLHYLPPGEVYITMITYIE